MDLSAVAVECGLLHPCVALEEHVGVTVGDFSLCRSCPCSTCSDTVSVCATRSLPTCTSTCSASRAAPRTQTTTRDGSCCRGMEEELGFYGMDEDL